MKNITKPSTFIGGSSIEDLKLLLKNNKYSQTIVLTDENTHKFCYSILAHSLEKHHTVTVLSGEEHKEINACAKVWEELSNINIDRNAVIINLGGGMVCDMGGFIAATFKRGIDFIHIPTTLLAMCDASIGCKLGINFLGLKNYIGVFKNPAAIVIYPNFLKTLPEKQVVSGFAEIIKHALIADKRLFNEISDMNDFSEDLEKLISRSIRIKTRIVNLDIFEKGIRKSLNFGHSIGHAIESYYIIQDEKTETTHGEAIAAGMIAESFISFRKKFLNEKEFQQIILLINKYYQKIKINSQNLGTIIDLISKDKKNEHSAKLFTLLDGIGQFRINEPVGNEEILESLKFYQNL